MIVGLAKIANIRRSMKSAKLAINAAKQAEEAGRSAARAIAAAESGKVIEDMRKAAEAAKNPQPTSEQRRMMMTADELMNWRGPLPDGMDGSETL